MKLISSVLLALIAAPAVASGPFDGLWTAQICAARSDSCSEALFRLYQENDRLCGDHQFVAPGAARVNEGGPGTVRGVVVGGVAVLAVRSGRNGAVLIGRARLKDGKLLWEPLDAIREGDPVGDAMILGAATLKRSASEDSARTSFGNCSKAPN
jgi:hypothetical protein